MVFMLTRTLMAAVAAAALMSPGMSGAQTLPAEIAASKTIKIAVNSGYVPMEMRDPSGGLIGFDVDLANAMAKVLGVKLEWQDGSFEQLTPALQSHRVDMIISGMSDLPRRRGSFDFIDYVKSGAQFFGVAKEEDVKAADDLCGKTVSTPRGTSYPGIIEKFSQAKCIEVGKPAITVLTPTDSASALSDMRQGRAVAGMQGTESVPSIMAREPGVYRLLGDPVTKALQGIAFNKTDTELRDAVMAALKKVIADGEYDVLIKKWNLGLSAYPAPTINEGPAP
jgi:polar amino acid transport system substrate-binding protein